MAGRYGDVGQRPFVSRYEAGSQLAAVCQTETREKSVSRTAFHATQTEKQRGQTTPLRLQIHTTQRRRGEFKWFYILQQ